MTEEVTVSADLKELGDKILALTLKQAVELGNYLKSQGVEPAGGGVVMAAPAAGAAAAAPAEEKTSFDAVLKSAGANKIAVIKVVRALTSLGLKEAKDLVEGAPKPVKQGVPKAEAEDAVKQLKDAGAEAEVA